MDGRVLERRSGVVVADWRNVFIEILGRPVTMDDLRLVRAHAKEIHRRHPEGVASFIVVEAGGIGELRPEVRAEAEAQSRDFSSIGSAIVIESSGFRGAAARTIIAGIHLVSRVKFPRKIFDAVPPASHWLAQHVLQSTAAEPDAARLRAFIEEARSVGNS